MSATSERRWTWRERLLMVLTIISVIADVAVIVFLCVMAQGLLVRE